MSGETLGRGMMEERDKGRRVGGSGEGGGLIIGLDV